MLETFRISSYLSYGGIVSITSLTDTRDLYVYCGILIVEPSLFRYKGALWSGATEALLKDAARLGEFRDAARTNYAKHSDPVNVLHRAHVWDGDRV